MPDYNSVIQKSGDVAKTPVDGFILCGGKATRLEGINGLMPKCLLRVDGMSVLGRLIYGLEQYLSRITVSFAGDVRIYKETLSAELSAAVMDKINFEYDPPAWNGHGC